MFEIFPGKDKRDDLINGYPYLVVFVAVISLIEDNYVSFANYAPSLKFFHYGLEESCIVGRSLVDEEDQRPHSRVFNHHRKFKSNIIALRWTVIPFELPIFQFFLVDLLANPVQIQLNISEIHKYAKPFHASNGMITCSKSPK